MEKLSAADGVYVIDAATLSELAALDCLGALRTLASVLVTSHTRDLIEQKLGEVKTERTAGTAFERNGQLGFVERTEEDRAREVAFLQAIADAIRMHCRVVPAYGTDEIAGIAVELERAVSSEECSVLLAAAEHKATLLALDARLRVLAAQLGLGGAWPQALLMLARDRGVISRQEYSLACVKQLVSNRTFISVSAEDLVAMTYQGSGWLKHGLKAFKRHISLPETNFESASRVALGYVQLLTEEGPCHFGAICRLLEQVSEGLFRHKDVPADYVSRLVDTASKLFGGGEGAPYRAQLLRKAVRTGFATSRERGDRELLNVEVLACSSPPWVAHVSTRRGDKSPESLSPAAPDLGSTKEQKGSEDGDKGGTSTSIDADESPFK